MLKKRFPIAHQKPKRTENFHFDWNRIAKRFIQ